MAQMWVTKHVDTSDECEECENYHRCLDVNKQAKKKRTHKADFV